MPRVKRSVHARKKRRKVLEQAKGYWGLKNSSYRYAKEQVEHSLVYAYRDRKNKKRTFRRLWIMRINAAARAERALVQPVRRRLQEGGDRARPQGARRPRGERPGRVRRDRRAGEGRAPGTQARGLPRPGPTAAGRVAALRRALPPARRRAARRELAGEERWDAPLRLLGGLHYLVLAGGRRGRTCPRRSPSTAGSCARSSPSRACRRTRCSAPGRCCRPSSAWRTDGRST